MNTIGGFASALYTPSMQPTPAMQRNVAAGGVNAREQTEKVMERQMEPVAEPSVRSAIEAKGLFIDTYA